MLVGLKTLQIRIKKEIGTLGYSRDQSILLNVQNAENNFLATLHII